MFPGFIDILCNYRLLRKISGVQEEKDLEWGIWNIRALRDLKVMKEA